MTISCSTSATTLPPTPSEAFMLRSEIDGIPNTRESAAALAVSLERRLRSLSDSYPDLSFRNNGSSFRIVIPREDRVLGGSTFGQLIKQFLKYVRNPQSLPNWEQPNLLAKYYITTTAVELADR